MKGWRVTMCLGTAGTRCVAFVFGYILVMHTRMSPALIATIPRCFVKIFSSWSNGLAVKHSVLQTKLKLIKQWCTFLEISCSIDDAGIEEALIRIVREFREYVTLCFWKRIRWRFHRLSFAWSWTDCTRPSKEYFQCDRLRKRWANQLSNYCVPLNYKNSEWFRRKKKCFFNQTTTKPKRRHTQGYQKN